MSSPDNSVQEAQEEPAALEQAYRAVLEELQTALGDAVVGSELRPDDLWVRVRPDVWRRAAEVCRQQLDMDYFCYLSGIDWMPSAPNPEEAATETDTSTDDDAESGAEAADTGPGDEAAGARPTEAGDEAPSGWQTGVAGGESRFQVLARLYSTTRRVGVTLKADLDDDTPTVESWVPVYRGADWHERETWEMYGFEFAGHPGLRHLYLPSAFEGFPLRKDFPLLAREVKPWPGLVDVEPMPEEPEAKEPEAKEPEAKEPEAEDAGGEGRQ